MYLPTGLRGKTLSPSRIIAGNQEGGGHEEADPRLVALAEGESHGGDDRDRGEDGEDPEAGEEDLGDHER